jgi:hypothetical protein
LGVQSDKLEELREDGLVAYGKHTHHDVRGVFNQLSHESVLAHRILMARFEADRRAYGIQHPSNGLSDVR